MSGSPLPHFSMAAAAAAGRRSERRTHAVAAEALALLLEPLGTHQTTPSANICSCISARRGGRFAGASGGDTLRCLMVLAGIARRARSAAGRCGLTAARGRRLLSGWGADHIRFSRSDSPVGKLVLDAQALWGVAILTIERVAELVVRQATTHEPRGRRPLEDSLAHWYAELDRASIDGTIRLDPELR